MEAISRAVHVPPPLHPHSKEIYLMIDHASAVLPGSSADPKKSPVLGKATYPIKQSETHYIGFSQIAETATINWTRWHVFNSNPGSVQSGNVEPLTTTWADSGKG